MENLITKELLSDIFGFEIRKINPSILDGNLYYYKKFVKCKSKINIYELAHKCKEWANSKGFDVLSSCNTDEKCWVQLHQYNTKLIGSSKYFHSFTEYKAIFKACEHIRKELLK